VSLLNVVCCQVELSASSSSLVQKSYSECRVSECDREASVMGRPWSARGCCAMGKQRLSLECVRMQYAVRDQEVLFLCSDFIV
jgi:hypothetical protein